MTIKWNLRLAMAKEGIFSLAELGRRMEDRGNYRLTPPALSRLAGGKSGEPPKEIKLATLNALLDALDFPATDFGVFQYEPPSAANRAAQPLVVNGDVRAQPTKRAARPKRQAGSIRRTPPPDAQ